MPINIHTAPYPGFPTDLQPQLAPLLAAFFGGKIREGVWRARFGYLRELEKFGVKYELLPSEAIIYPSRFNSAEVTAPDLRGGAALVIAALASEGESIINSADVIGRGYENIVKKLLCVGADIEERNT